jgi:predicted transcriptional regulator
MSMRKIQAKIKTSFGEIIVEGENAQEIIETLNSLPPQFMNKIDNLVSTKLTSPMKTQLEGIIELTTQGPVITTREKLTHYQAIGLILYASEEKISTATQISRLLSSSGIKSMVPARLNEMTKRGLVFKPDPAKPEFKLTTQGERWVEEELLVRLRGQ